MPNIQATGLQTRFAADGMLGNGVYGAPDPRKSKHYCGKKKDTLAGQFIFLCRYNLSEGAKHAGPATKHKNTMYDEFCVFDDRYMVPLWMIKLADMINEE